MTIGQLKSGGESPPSAEDSGERFPKNLHAPPQSTWVSRFLGRFYFTGPFWYQIHLWGVQSWRRPLLPVWVGVFSVFFFVVLGRVRRNLMANLSVILGPAGLLRSWGRAYHAIRDWAWCRSEKYERFEWGEDDFTFVIEGQEHWDAASSGERGLIVLSTHLGNFESGTFLPKHLLDRTIHLVREPELDPKAQAWMDRLKEKKVGGVDIVTHIEIGDDFQRGLELLGALRRGDIVAVTADRPRSGGRVVRAELFGRPFPIPEGPAILARTAEVPMILLSVIREGRRRYRVVLRPPIVVERTADRQADIERAVRQMASDVEHVIARAPTQWFCFQRVFD
ncbi:MAG: lysophospholipid acyltransferase family protein [Planctomycetota bacterium]